MTDLTTPLRFPERLTAARRLAVGFPVASVARAANRTVDLIDDLTRDPDFLQLVASWHDLFSLSAEARTRRLMKLAHAALEAALTCGPGIATSTALALLELERRKVDPVVHLAEGLSRIAGREIRRLQKAAAAAGEAGPGAAAPAADAAPPGDPRRRPARPADSFARRVDAVAARLRGEIVAEHGWTSEPLGRDDLNLSSVPPAPAAEAAPTATADEAVAQPVTSETEAAATNPEDAAPITPGGAAAEQKLEKMMRGELAGLSAEKLAVLARFSPDDWARFFLQMMRPGGQEPPSEAAGPGKGAGWPEGP